LRAARREHFDFEIYIGYRLNRIVSHILFSQQLALWPPLFSPQSG
jgi:hypothetical protein